MDQCIINDQYLQNIANSIKRKLSISETIQVPDMPSMIDEIGIDLSDTTAEPDSVISGKTYYSADESKETGKLITTKCKNKFYITNINERYFSTLDKPLVKITDESPLCVYISSIDFGGYYIFTDDVTGSIRYEIIDNDNYVKVIPNTTVFSHLDNTSKQQSNVIANNAAIATNGGFDIFGIYYLGNEEILLIYSWLSSNTTAKIQRPAIYARVLSKYTMSPAFSMFGAVTLPYGTTAGSYYEKVRISPLNEIKNGLGDFLVTYYNYGITSANVINAKRAYGTVMFVWSNNTSVSFFNIGTSFNVNVSCNASDGSDVYITESPYRNFSLISKTSAGVVTYNNYYVNQYIRAAAKNGPDAPKLQNKFIDSFTPEANEECETLSGAFASLGELENGNIVYYRETINENGEVFEKNIYIGHMLPSRSANVGVTIFTDKLELDYPINVDNTFLLKNNIIVQLSSPKLSNDIWIESSTLPYIFLNGSAVLYNDEIHILGSSNNSNYTKHYKYDGIEWIEVSTLPYNFYGGSTVIYNNEIHILGGNHNSTFENNYQNCHYKWNGEEWIKLSKLPCLFKNGSAVVYDNEIHIMGGVNTYRIHYKYDFENDQWIFVSTLPYDFYQGSAVVYNNEIHIMGSGNNSNYTKHYKYDINTNTWTSVSTLPYNFYQGSAIVYNNEIHILGSSGVNQTSHYKWNGIEWTEVSTLPYNFFNSKTIVYNNEIHILGSGASGTTTNHYKYKDPEFVGITDAKINQIVQSTDVNKPNGYELYKIADIKDTKIIDSIISNNSGIKKRSIKPVGGIFSDSFYNTFGDNNYLPSTELSFEDYT